MGLLYLFLICYLNFVKAVVKSYHQDLDQAIMLSKIAYQLELENVTKPDKEQEQSKKGNNKKSKKATMSLEEFNNMGANETQKSTERSEDTNLKNKGSILFLTDTIINFNCSNLFRIVEICGILAIIIISLTYGKLCTRYRYCHNQQTLRSCNI